MGYYEHFGLKTLIADATDEQRRVVEEACAVLDTRQFNNKRLDQGQTAPDEKLRPIGIRLCWRSGSVDPKKEDLFQKLTVILNPDEELAHLFHPALEAFPGHQKFTSIGQSDLAVSVDVLLTDLQRPVFIGALVLYRDRYGNPVTTLWWHPSLPFEIVFEIFRRFP